MVDRELLKEEALKELARREFWYYCQYMHPGFYTEDKDFLKDFCYRLQKFVESDKKVIVINIPPRHAKSFTGTNFVPWLLGKNPKEKIMTASYNETLSTTFAAQVRDTIAEEKSAGIRSYCDLFPGTKIKYGQASKSKWKLEGSSVDSYLATSPGGTATGFGATILIIDDLIKNSKEAYNQNVLLEHIHWFNNTMLSRTEKGFKIIIIMTRWATNDLAGYILNNWDDVVHINYKAVQEDGSMLCDSILSKEDFELKTKNMDKAIVYANYQQEPIDIEGRLYDSIKTYKEIPWEESLGIHTRVDTADKGEDNLCSIVYAKFKDRAYILDIIYTKEGVRITQPMVAKQLKDYKVDIVRIESNFGGESYAMGVEEKTRALGNYSTVFDSFHQKGSKITRILSNSAWVQENIYLPVGWEDKYPEFANEVLHFQKEGKNAHDDGVDVLSGIAEDIKAPDSFEWGY